MTAHLGIFKLCSFQWQQGWGGIRDDGEKLEQVGGVG